MANMAVIGAGITGITTAYELVLQGHQVTVFDRHRYAAMETSYANGGQISASNAEVWNNWSIIGKGMKWLLKADAPLLFNLSPSWHKYSWLAEFIGATRKYRENSMETVRLALMSRARLLEIAETENFDFHHEKRGLLHFYKNAEDMTKAGRVNDMLCEAGLERHHVDVPEIQRLEPALDTANVCGGYYTPGDGSGDIHAFTRGLAEICRQRGVEFHLGAEISDCAASNDSVSIKWADLEGDADQQTEICDGVVVCAGIASRDFAKKFGDRVNVYPVKGYSITIPLKDDAQKNVAPWVALLDESTKIVASRLGADRYRVAGTAEFNGKNYDIRADRVRPLIDWVEKHHPALDTSGSIPWAGLRPMMPDMMPRVEQGRCSRVFYNTGHGHLGWTLSAATGAMVAALVTDRLGGHNFVSFASDTHREVVAA